MLAELNPTTHQDANAFFEEFLAMQRLIDLNQFVDVPGRDRMADFYRQTKAFTHSGEVFVGLRTWVEGSPDEELIKCQQKYDIVYGPGQVIVRLDTRIGPWHLSERPLGVDSRTYGYLETAQFGGVFLRQVGS